MKEFEIIEADKYIYSIKDKEDNKYKLNADFMDIDKTPSIGDFVYMTEKLLKENIPYTFGPLHSKYGRKMESAEDEDILILKIGEEVIYLQRYYG